ncbi:endonuclease/exonuclease/phosphatase family protein [Pseudoalteromonas denitrificans]|uniref:Endonuclease/Exonuclease/phosphatase family protein n=1 Tax=Pseudoalteromonas denitrificans DSM 6059 TaxID=1123010 RepID=A0A1I1SU79_9GAMM|nr:endonuclease/exonuclease/phosphatase family protein [Pseudoalteromonas denitrificans]SFD49946.1 Endonuclease/Exonuclease/phosphatase family protein [Pseudoalteromonas denitrificans DSM 6059]
MNKLIKSFSICAFMSVLTGCEHPNHTIPSKETELQKQNIPKMPIKIATWNAEHLAYPNTSGCKPRSSIDILKMKNYAKRLDAKIIALQEVASEDALRLIFPKKSWQIILSDKPDSPSYECRKNGFTSTQQKVAFAVHKSVPILKVNHNDQFNLGMPGLRYGLAITVKTALGNTEILNLHLKSGCFINDYLKSDSRACQTLAKQVPLLDSWIEHRENITSPYIILGDFNHRLSTPANRMFQELNNIENKTVSNLHLTTQNLISCHPRYPAPIDHIIIGGTKMNIKDISAHVHSYINMNETAMLSDHCAISINI